MTPDFSIAVDPIFQHALELLDRVGRNDVATPNEEREWIRRWFTIAEERLPQRKTEWELAKYALVAWVDELLIVDAPWEGRNWWENNALEFEVFNSNDRATEFYLRAEKAAAMTKTDALEVFYICTALGFRGMYRDPDQEAAMLADHLRLPPTFEDWAQKTARTIRWSYGRPPIDDMRRSPRDNAPLEGRFALLGTVVMGAVLAAVLAGLLMVFTGWTPFDS